MQVIHKELYQVLDESPDNINTFAIDEDHDWILGVQPEKGFKWQWDEENSTPVILEDSEYLSNQLIAAKNIKILSVTNSAEAKVAGGIVSDVLGENHIYDTRAVDQINWEHALSQAKINDNPEEGEEGHNYSLPSAGKGWISCCEEDGEDYVKIGHTEEQINTLRSEFLIHKYSITEEMNDLIEAINFAKSIEELEGLG